MAVSVSSIHPIVYALYYESAFSEPPGYNAITAKGGTAAAWATAEGTNADRINVISGDPAFARQSVIEDPRMKERVNQTFKRIKGLKNADGGSIVLTLHGSGATTAASSQIAETALMRIMKHAFGGLHRGNSTEVALPVTSNVVYEVDSTTNLVAGALIAIEDDDNTGNCYPQRITAVSGTELTLDQTVPFTVAENDNVHAVAVAYVDEDALLNPSDGDYSTLSVLIQKGSVVWELVGAHLQINSIEFPRNDVPRVNFSIYASGLFPPGDDDNPGVPVWTGTITGDAGVPIGALTKLHISDYNSTTTTCVDVVSLTVNPGLPIVPIDTLTQCDANAQGRAGFTHRPELATIEAQVFLDTDWQGDFDDDTYKNVRYFYPGAPGAGWIVQASYALVEESPEYSEANESVMQTLRFSCHENETVASPSALFRSKILVGMF